MSKLITFCLVILIEIISVISVDYCELENKICGGRQHVGCTKNENDNISSISSEGINIILDKINDFRNSIALGFYDGFPKSSNMRLMSWDTDLADVATHSVNNVLPKNYTCISTEQFRNPSEYTYEESSELFDGINDVLEDLISTIIETSLLRKSDLSRFYIANNSRIGCAYKISENDDKNYLIKCLTNENDVSNVNLAYQTGEPCLRCDSWRNTCNIVHLGLCGSHELPLSNYSLAISENREHLLDLVNRLKSGGNDLSRNFYFLIISFCLGFTFSRY